MERGCAATRGWGRVVEREDLIQRGLEGDESGADEGVAGVSKLVAVEGHPRGEGSVGVVAQPLRVAHGDEEQVQRPGLDGAGLEAAFTLPERWSSQLNCAGVRRRRLGQSNRFSTIGVSLDDVECQLLEPARGDRDVFL